MSMPYLAWVHPDYDTAQIRLVVVGKETQYWGKNRQLLNEGSEEAVRVDA
jgi:hypothetical protein